MLKTNNPSTKLADESADLTNLSHFNTQELAFELALTPQILLQLLHAHHLKASDVIGNYVVNQQALNQLMQSLPFDDPQDFLENNTQFAPSIIHTWPAQLNWVQFNAAIDQLLHAWLEDYQTGTSLDTAFLLAHCLTLEAPQTRAPSHDNTVNFQCLLMHLLARTTNQFDQYQYHFSQHFDLETHLPNQKRMLDLLSKANTNNIAILLIHLNVNLAKESHLSEISADLVQAAIAVIQQNIGSNAALFRISTFELAMIVDDLHFAAQLNLIASKLAAAFEHELPLEDITLILKPHFGGICLINTHANALSLLESAKLALHYAIANNSQIEIFDQLITTESTNKLALDEAIINALQQNELELFFHAIVSLPKAPLPKISLPNNTQSIETCTSAELLLRWQNSQFPHISPIKLIDTIYKKGFGKVFIRWLINTACRHHAELMAEYALRISLTINLCSTDLLDADLPEMLEQAMQLWDVPAENLIIEITESDLLIDENQASLVLGKIVSLGCKTALDDFGTGYSSMARLRNMPIDLVKIDQSFVRNIAHSNQDKEIVSSILNLAHSLGKQVVAEGVEEMDCLNILKEMHCDKIQGYYYAKPQSYENFVAWLHQFNTPHGV